MLLIIEGCDAAGKTTLKDKLVSRYGFVESVPKSLPTEKTDQTMCGENATAINLCLNDGEDVVMDRSWLSEAIYSPLLRKMDGRFSKTQIRMLERMAYTVGVVIVLCDPGWPEVLKNWQERGDEHITSEVMLRRIYEEYRNLYKNTGIPIITYNYTREQNLLEFLTRVRKVMVQKTFHPEVFGCANDANTLVVCSPPARRGDVPFISWRDDSMPAKITRAFERAGLSEYELAWTYTSDHELRHIVVAGRYDNVVYIGSDLTLSVESALNGLDVDIWYAPVPSKEMSYKTYLPQESA